MNPETKNEYIISDDRTISVTLYQEELEKLEKFSRPALEFALRHPRSQWPQALDEYSESIKLEILQLMPSLRKE